MVRLGDCGKSLSASAIGARFSCLMEGRDMVGELGYQRGVQPTSFGELVEQATFGPEANSTICGPVNRSDLEI